MFTSAPTTPTGTQHPPVIFQNFPSFAHSDEPDQASFNPQGQEDGVGIPGATPRTPVPKQVSLLSQALATNRQVQGEQGSGSGRGRSLFWRHTLADPSHHMPYPHNAMKAGEMPGGGLLSRQPLPPWMAQMREQQQQEESMLSDKRQRPWQRQQQQTEDTGDKRPDTSDSWGGGGNAGRLQGIRRASSSGMLLHLPSPSPSFSIGGGQPSHEHRVRGGNFVNINHQLPRQASRGSSGGGLGGQQGSPAGSAPASLRPGTTSMTNLVGLDDVGVEAESVGLIEGPTNKGFNPSAGVEWGLLQHEAQKQQRPSWQYNAAAQEQQPVASNPYRLPWVSNIRTVDELLASQPLLTHAAVADDTAVAPSRSLEPGSSSRQSNNCHSGQQWPSWFHDGSSYSPIAAAHAATATTAPGAGTGYNPLHNPMDRHLEEMLCGLDLLGGVPVEQAGQQLEAVWHMHQVRVLGVQVSNWHACNMSWAGTSN